MKDSHYTTPDLANTLVGFSRANRVSTVVDFCVGGGELLRAAQSKFPDAICYGTDISSTAINTLKKAHRCWHVAMCNFLSVKERRRIHFLNGKFDLILLNPPFTCKGGTMYEIEYNNINYKVSTAMLFLIHTLDYIASSGEILAIMPASTIYSQKDRKIWDALSNHFKINILKKYEKHKFKECSPNIVLISLIKGKSRTANFLAVEKLCNIDRKIRFDIMRGKLSMHKARNLPGTMQIIHSTTIKNNSLLFDHQCASFPRSEISGPAVLLPRVGKPSVKKICYINQKSAYVLSDCVIALRTETLSDAIALFNMIVVGWDQFVKLYQGTGAKYITLDRIKFFFSIQ